MPTKSDFPERAKLENENRTLQDRLSCFELERNEMQREIEWMQQELEQPKVSPPLPAGPTDSAEHDESFLLKKQQRIEELEHAVRESLQITTEREYAMTQQKRKMENLEKQVSRRVIELLSIFDRLGLDQNTAERSRTFTRRNPRAISISFSIEIGIERTQTSIRTTSRRSNQTIGQCLHLAVRSFFSRFSSSSFRFLFV